MLNEFHTADGLEFMRAMPDDSVDLVVTSPNYEDARTYGIEADNVKLRGELWVEWFKPYVREMIRVSTGLVAIVVDGKTSKFNYSATPFLLMADLIREGYSTRHPFAFYRHGVPGSGGPDWFRNDWEPVICFSSGRLPWSDNTATGKPPKYKSGGTASNRTKSGKRANAARGCVCDVEEPEYDEATGTCLICERKKPKPYIRPKIANPGNVKLMTYDVLETGPHSGGDIKKIVVGGGRMGDPIAHENEAPFPESLVEVFVRSCCPPGGVVLDPFSGSGTTAATAFKFNRKFIGVDCRESQSELGRKRIAKLEAEALEGFF